MTTAPPNFDPSVLGPIVMVDASYTDFDIARRMYARSELANPFVHLDSAFALTELLDNCLESNEPPPRLILMDLNMPGISGIEATAALRARPECCVLPIVVVLTSSVDPKDRDRARKAGADAYISKPMNPFDYVDMFNSFQRWTNLDETPPPAR